MQRTQSRSHIASSWHRCHPLRSLFGSDRIGQLSENYKWDSYTCMRCDGDGYFSPPSVFCISRTAKKFDMLSPGSYLPIRFHKTIQWNILLRNNIYITLQAEKQLLHFFLKNKLGIISTALHILLSQEWYLPIRFQKTILWNIRLLNKVYINL